MQAPSFIIALDVGGSSVKSGLVQPDRMTVIERSRAAVDSRGPADDILATFAGCIRGHAGVARSALVLGVALAFPGPFDYETGICRIAGVSKYESLFGLDIGRELASRTGFTAADFSFVNDAEAAIAGEVAHGAARGYRRVIGITLGTGLGSGFFENGVRVSAGPGVPANGGWLFDQPFAGTMADECFSIRGLQRRLAAAGTAARAPETAAAGARGGDEGLQAVFAAFADDLGTFLRPYVETFKADAVLVGGGISGAFDLFGAMLEERLARPVVRGSLGMDAPLLGAADAFLRKRQ